MHSNPKVDEFLVHYGVKGMKWGIRHEPKEKDLNQFTDQELRERVNRMNLEKNYRSLTTSQSTKAGQKFTQKYQEQILGAAATAAAGVTVIAVKNAPSASRALGRRFYGFIADHLVPSSAVNHLTDTVIR